MSNINTQNVHNSNCDKFILTTEDKRIFNQEEREILIKYGKRFVALVNGTLVPKTPDQERFVKVIKGDLKPETIYEKLWIKYLKRKEILEKRPVHIIPNIIEDTFHNREMVKQVKKIMFNTNR